MPCISLQWVRPAVFNIGASGHSKKRNPEISALHNRDLTNSSSENGAYGVYHLRFCRRCRRLLIESRNLFGSATNAIANAMMASVNAPLQISM